MTEPRERLREQRAKAWLVGGGGGHEDGEDGLRALRLTSAGLIDFLAAYEEWLASRQATEQALLHSPSDRPTRCYCPPDECQAPVVMGRQMPCLREQPPATPEPQSCIILKCSQCGCDTPKYLNVQGLGCSECNPPHHVNAAGAPAASGREANRTNGWDERDYKLWSEIRSLNSYGLIASDIDNPMLSRKEVLKLLEVAAEKRFDDAHH